MAENIVWMSTAEAAEYLGVTLRTVYRFIDDGQLPAYKFGRVIRVKETDVEAFVEASRILPGSLEHLHPEPAPHASGAARAASRTGALPAPSPASSPSPGVGPLSSGSSSGPTPPSRPASKAAGGRRSTARPPARKRPGTPKGNGAAG